MILVMSHGATLKQIGEVIQRLEGWNIAYNVSRGEERTVIGILGQTSHLSRETMMDLPGVEEVIRITKPFKLASRDFHPNPSVIRVNGTNIGAEQYLVVIAGPCSVESA